MRLLESLKNRLRGLSGGSRLPREPSAFFAYAKASNMPTGLAYHLYMQLKAK
jgi:hypothetical protein